MSYLDYCSFDIWVFTGCFTFFIIYDIAKSIWLKATLIELHKNVENLSDEIVQMREEMSFDLLDMGIEIIDSEEDSDEEYVPSDEEAEPNDEEAAPSDEIYIPMLKNPSV